MSGSHVNTIIGAGTVLDGNIDVDGMVRIDGSVRGDVRTQGRVVIGRQGRCESSIRAKSAVIGGLVKGDVLVTERITILPGGIIVGNVFTPHLDADGDVTIHGVIAITGNTRDAPEDLREFAKKHGASRMFAERLALARPSYADSSRRSSAYDEGRDREWQR
jgi:cytoskeletal protein CcmA (bactofilin family)